MVCISDGGIKVEVLSNHKGLWEREGDTHLVSLSPVSQCGSRLFMLPLATPLHLTTTVVTDFVSPLLLQHHTSYLYMLYMYIIYTVHTLTDRK